MKKVIIAFVAIALAVGVQAATVKWTGSGIVGTDGVAAGNTYTAYLFALSDSSSTFTTTTIADAIASVNAGTVVGSISQKTLLSGLIASTTASASAATGTMELFAIVVDAGMDNYLLLSTKSVVVASPTSTYTASWASVNNVAGDWVATSVPEPTSGLLLLLGMAGLALRRRRA